MIACLSAGLVAGTEGVSSVTANATDGLVSDTLTMTKGASLYLEEVSGLKFQYTIANYDASANKNYGMLIVPYDYLETAGISLTDEVNDDYIAKLTAANFENAPIVVENLTPSAAGVVEYSIGSILEDNYAREFFGLGFEKTGENTYEYATPNENVRSVFEVANLALNKLNFGTWDESDEEAMKEKALLASKETDVLNTFITKGFAFVYGENATLSLSAVTYEGGEVTPTITTTKEKTIDLKVHWSCETGDLTRGANQTVEAKLGKLYTENVSVDVLKDETELEIYNNSGKAEFFDESITANTNAFSTVSLSGGNFRTGSAYTKDSGYIAFKNPNAEDGKYTLDNNGTYVDFYFTGNNMPNVEFFGNSISGNMWKDNENKGYVVNNGHGPAGLYTNYATAKDLINTTDYTNLSSSYKHNGIVNYPAYFRYGVSDYNKLSANGTSVTDQRYTLNMAYYGSDGWVSDYGVAYSTLSMWSLMQDETKNWHYTVGMYQDAENNVYLDAKLYEILANGTELAFAQYNAQVETVTETVSGYIVVHGAIKGQEDGSSAFRRTELSYGLPYAGNATTRGVSSGATFNADGSVTLQTNSANSASYDFLKGRTMGYVALDGSYGLGTYIDIYFTGSNMPMVSFFNKYVTDTVTDYVDGTNTNSGILMFNAFYKQSGDVGSAYYGYRYTVCGPNRVSTTSMDSSRLHYDGGFKASEASKISAPTLATMAEQQFKYTVGFYLNAESKVCISVDVDKVDANGNKVEDYFAFEKALEVTQEDIKGDKIILYGGFNGSYSPTFRYSAPYTK